MSKTLRLILGDQLNIKHSWFSKTDSTVIFCMMEMRQETDYTTHHIQKVIGFFSAMREFAKQLTNDGHRIIYFEIDHESNKQSIEDNLNFLLKSEDISRFEYILPDEHRLDEQLKKFCNSTEVETRSYDSEHFYTSRNELSHHFEGKKQWVMESFYRMMRENHNVLMQGSKPLGGKWNYDASNRKKMPQHHKPTTPFIFDHDVSILLKTIKNTGIKTIGNIDPKHFVWPINRSESLDLLDYFLENW